MAKQQLTREDLASALTVLAGAMLVFVGFRTVGIPAAGNLVVVAGSMWIYSGAVALFIAGVGPVDCRRHAYKLAALAVASVVVGFVMLISAMDGGAHFGTDAQLFATVAADAVLEGTNPYTVSMAPTLEAYGLRDARYVTARTDGTVVTSLSYPAGSVLAYLPQAALGLGRKELLATPALASVALTGVLLGVTPRDLVLAVPSLLLAGNLFFNAFGGVFDVLWMLPLVVAMLLWADGRRGWASIAYGLAVSVKQQPWFIGPFLLVWAYRDGGPRHAARVFLIASGTFAFINVPFVVTAPEAWLAGVVTPVAGDGAPLVYEGVALARLSESGILVVPRAVHAGLVVGAVLVLLGAYARLFDADPRVRWLAWVVPPVVLLFNYRALPSYWQAFVPVAFVAALASRGVIERGRLTTLVRGDAG